MKYGRWIIAGLGLVTVWLLWLAPASLMANMGALGGLQLQGASGSFWSGSAESARLQLAPYKGRQLVFDLGELHWQLQPVSLLALKLCATVESTLQAQEIKGRVCQSLTGSTRVTDLRLQIPASFVGLMAPIQASGQLQLAIDELSLYGQRIEAVSGSGRLSQLAVQLEKDWQNFGNVDVTLAGVEGGPFTAELISEDKAVQWRAQSDALALGLNGLEAHLTSTLTLSESYRLQWGNGLALLGFEERDGHYLLETKLP
jgi:general secretion pathway protein N